MKLKDSSSFLMRMFSALTVLLLSIQDLCAQDEFEEVRVLDHPRYSLTKRIALDAELSFLPLDAYYKPLMIDVAASYQLTDWFAWEVARLSWSLTNYDTGLNSSINARIEDFTEEPVDTKIDQSFEKLKYKISSTAFFNLLYSKSNFFNQAIVYHYWQAGLGFGFYDLDFEKQQSLDVVLRARFFINRNFMLNLRGGHSFGFNSKAPKNISFLSLGGGFAF